MEDYNITTDTAIKRTTLREILRSEGPDAIWTLERPLYDLRYDAYWLVTRTHTGYVFTGPITLSAGLLDLLPNLSEAERREVMRHAPRDYTEAPHGMPVDFIEEHNDGA